jgi:hypothetical protein
MTDTPFLDNGAQYGSFTDLLTDLDVATDNTPTTAVLGDNLIDPLQPDTTLPTSNGYRVPDELAAAAPTMPSPYGVIDEGIEANQLMTSNPESYNGDSVGGPAALSRLDRDILDQPNLTTVVISEGLEDLLNGTATDATLDSDGYTALVQELQGWGLTVVLTSLTPCDGFTGDGATPNDPCTSAIDTEKASVNAFLGSGTLGSWWDTPPVYFADFEAAVADQEPCSTGCALVPAADGGDHANLSIAAFGALTNAILSPQDTWNLDDGEDGLTASDTAATDNLYTPSTITNPNTGNNPLTLSTTGTNWTTDSTRGTVLTLDGASGYGASTGPVLTTNASFSVSAWVNLATAGTQDQTIVAQQGTTGSAFYLEYNDSKTGSPGWAFGVTSADSASPSVALAYAAGASTNTWTHLVGVYNAVTHTAQLYVNGTLAQTTTGATTWNAAGALSIGAGLSNGILTGYFGGSLSDVQAWNYALAPNQITALYQQIQASDSNS